MFRQGPEEPAAGVVRPLPPDLTARLTGAKAPTPVESAAVAMQRLPARSRDERRLARIDRRVAGRGASETSEPTPDQ